MKMQRSAFDQLWNRLADESKVDLIGGAEYRRVLGEWRVKGYPDVSPEWIVERANLPLGSGLRTRRGVK